MKKKKNKFKNNKYQFVPNSGYQIKTPLGNENFQGINKILFNKYIKLWFSNGIEIKCSVNHPFLTHRGFVKAKHLKYDDYIETDDDIGCFVIKKRTIRQQIYLYDIVNSGIENTYYTNGIVSHNCEFFGSAGTLISGPKLQILSFKEPIELVKESLKIYEYPKKEHSYVASVDTSEGVGKDYSVINIIDVTEVPYRQVAVYRRNDLIPMIFADEVFNICRYYNDAFCVVESNSIGNIVTNILYYEYEYDNLLQSASSKGETVINSKSTVGLRQTTKTKSIGCATLKTLIESDSLLICDFETIGELGSFIKRGSSYQAEKNKTDDIVMCIHGSAMITTENGEKPMRWIVNNKYDGKVLSLDKDGNFVWKKILNHIVRPNKDKKWIGIRGNSRNTLMCTTDHKCAYIEDIFNPEIKYIDAIDMLGRYNVIFPKKRFNLTNPLYNKEQLSAIIGSIIGDSSISKNGRLTCAHGDSQKEYSLYKHDIFKGKQSERISKKGEKRYIYHITEAYTNAQTKKLRDLFYIDGKKSIKNIIDFIDDIALAFWYMDDGYRIKSTINDAVLFCTDDFSIEDVKLLVDMFKIKFNINTRIVFYKNKPRIRISSKESYKFWDIVSPYIIESMDYKIPDNYKGIKKKLINNECLNFGSEIITKIMDRGKGWQSKLYDIEVEETHNFIANGMVVHNCLVMFAWLTTQSYFEDYTNTNIRGAIRQNFTKMEEHDTLIFGFFNNGLNEENQDFSLINR